MLANLKRDTVEERADCHVLRGKEGRSLYKVVMPASSGLTDKARERGILNIGSLYAGVKGDSLQKVCDLVVAALPAA